jgi:N-acetylglucosamine-6-phosphate deacetylase
VQTIHSADKIFTGHAFLYDHAIVVNDGIVADLLPTEWLPGNFAPASHSHLLVPSFVDAQIYGARQKLFSVFPSADTLEQLSTHCRQGGTRYFLPTVATNTTTIMYQCIDAVKAYWDKGGKDVPGLHFEGPWINVARRGAHMQNLITAPALIEVEHLLEYGRGVIKMITLAPEVCSEAVLDLIFSHGITLSAGHSDATFEQATRAFDNGIPTATHLFNAMRPLHHRDTGLPGAVFQHNNAMASIIADGIHIDYNALAIAKRLMGARLFLITDAVTETTEGPYRHTLQGNKYVADGILSGSALTMLQAVKNCIAHAEIEPGEAFRMAGLYPAGLLGLEAGHIAKGKKASFLMLDEELNLQGMAD